MIFKIDFDKAYDHVNWDFLDRVMDKKVFGYKRRMWMLGCIRSALFDSYQWFPEGDN